MGKVFNEIKNEYLQKYIVFMGYKELLTINHDTCIVIVREPLN
jgi:hypothetical protein